MSRAALLHLIAVSFPIANFEIVRKLELVIWSFGFKVAHSCESSFSPLSEYQEKTQSRLTLANAD